MGADGWLIARARVKATTVVTNEEPRRIPGRALSCPMSAVSSEYDVKTLLHASGP